MKLADTATILSALFLGVMGDMPIGSETMEVTMHHGEVDEDKLLRPPLEDITSWELNRQRQRQRQQQQQQQQPGHSGRQLASYVTVENDDDEDTPYVIKHKKLKSHIPYAGGDTTHGMMIDAYVSTRQLSFVCKLFPPSY
jgi:hypothetical protein